MATHVTDEVDPHRRSSWTILARLSAMMFLQYWPLGIWGVTVGTFIAANTGEEGERLFSSGFVGYSTAAGAIGSLVAPVLIGFLSDRYFSAQRLLSLMHFICATAAWGMYEATTQIGFFLCLLLYFNCFTPAAALTNKIALRHLANSDAEYPLIRIFSTIGWISAGLIIGLVWPWATGNSVEAMRTPLLLGAFGSVAMGLYSLTLPDTPPEGRSERLMSRAVHDSAELLANRPLIVFLIISMFACIPSMAYNNYGNLFLNHQGFPRPAALMTLGQLSDVLFLWSTPWLIQRLGLRTLFSLGVIAWGIRYGLLAFGSTHNLAWPVYLAILIHGACFVFVYVVGVMYVDKLVSHTHRGTAQGLYALVSSGIGHLLGALTVGLSQQTFLTPEGVSPPPYHWPQFWIVPATISVATAIVFLIAFRPRERTAA